MENEYSTLAEESFVPFSFISLKRTLLENLLNKWQFPNFQPNVYKIGVITNPETVERGISIINYGTAKNLIL